MPTYRDEGIVLRTHKLGEADRIVTVLTRQHGKVRAVARGVRRTSSKFGGRLEPFSHVDVQFAQGRTLDVVAQVERLHAWGEPLVARYGAFTAGQVMLEAADKLVGEERESAPAQYRLLAGALRTLGQGTPEGMRPAGMILDAYLLRAMAVAGWAPTLESCAACGKPGPHPSFSPIDGGAVCAACRRPGSAALDPGTARLMSALLTGNWAATSPDPSLASRQTSGLVIAFVNWHLEHRLRSLPLLDRGVD